MFCTGLGAFSGGVCVLQCLVLSVFSSPSSLSSYRCPDFVHQIELICRHFQVSTLNFWISTGFHTVIPSCYWPSSAYFATVNPVFCAASLLIWGEAAGCTGECLVIFSYGAAFSILFGLMGSSIFA